MKEEQKADIRMAGMTDDKLKRYFNALWERYQWVKNLPTPPDALRLADYYAGTRAGLDFAIEALKSIFEIAEME